MDIKHSTYFVFRLDWIRAPQTVRAVSRLERYCCVPLFAKHAEPHYEYEKVTAIYKCVFLNHHKSLNTSKAIDWLRKQIFWEENLKIFRKQFQMTFL